MTRDESRTAVRDWLGTLYTPERLWPWGWLVILMSFGLAVAVWEGLWVLLVVGLGIGCLALLDAMSRNDYKTDHKQKESPRAKADRHGSKDGPSQVRR